MCGIISIIDHTPQGLWTSDGDAFVRMLILNSFRGWDSTGVAGVRKDNEVDIVKALGHPYNLFAMKAFAEWKLRINLQYNAIMGHGRLATKGEVSMKNAHPFKRGEIILIHNGTLTNFDDLKKEYSNPQVFSVDSDLCANHILKNGVQEALKQFEGAFAFIWYDQRDHTLRAVRNHERPLFIFERTDQKQHFLSSDPAIFDYLTSYNSIMKGTWKQIPAGDMLEFNMKDRTHDMVPVKFYTKVYPVHNNYNPGGYNVGTKFQDLDGDDIYEYGIPFLPIAEPKKPPAILTKIKQGSIEITVGDKINFSPTDWDEKQDMNTHSTWAIIKGIAIVDMPVEVRTRYDKPIEDIFDEPILQGTIVSIHPYQQNDPFVCRVFLKDIKPIKQSLIVDHDTGEILLDMADDSTISQHRFDLLIKEPCPCGQKIVRDQSKNCILIQGIVYCPDCTLQSKYPKNG